MSVMSDEAPSAECAECGERVPLGTTVCPTIYTTGRHDPRVIADPCWRCDGFGAVESGWDSFVRVPCPACNQRVTYREYADDRLAAILALEKAHGPLTGEIIEVEVF